MSWLLYQLDLPDTVYVDVAAPLHSVPHVVLQVEGGGEQGVEGEVAVGTVLVHASVAGN